MCLFLMELLARKDKTESIGVSLWKVIDNEDYRPILGVVYLASEVSALIDWIKCAENRLYF